MHHDSTGPNILARVKVEHGELQRARDLLAPVYRWFTEGFHWPDLIETKTLPSPIGLDQAPLRCARLE
jgi:hypothetical protein